MRPERWIDGYNLLHRMPDLAARVEEDLEAAREEFLRRLVPLALRGRERWTVVFDGPRGGRDRFPGPLSLVYCRDADAWILDSLRRHANPKTVTVVSSDEKDIGRAARQLGARVESAGTLLARLRKAGAPPPASEKPESESEEGVAYWMDRFEAPREEESE